MTLFGILVSLLALGCGRQTEALPIVQADVQPAPKNKPKDSFSGEPKATVQSGKPDLAVQDQKPKKEPGKDKDSALPKGKGGKLVDDLLRPRDKSLAKELTKKRLPGLGFLEGPEIALPKYKGLPPKLAVKDGGKPVRPKAAAEEIPLSRNFGDPKLPVVIKLEGTALVKWPMPDPNQPLPLPILAQPKSDRAPLTDPTADASTDAALSGTIPVRDNPAPFLRINLPDPFENRQTIRVRNPLPEDPTPQTR
jgi:hypothetical protein